MPNRILVDQGTDFGELFIHLAAENGSLVDKTGVETHSSLGLCERYHQPIRTVYRKLMMKTFCALNNQYLYEIGNSVLVWRENQISNRIGEWIGPYNISKVDYKRKLVSISDHSSKPFNITQVKRYYPLEKYAESFITKLQQSCINYVSPDDSDLIYLTEVIHPTDPRTKCPEMTTAKKVEIINLLRRSTFKVILK